MLANTKHNIWYFPKGLVLSPPPKKTTTWQWIGRGIDVLAYFALGGLIGLWLSSLGTDLSPDETHFIERNQAETHGRD